MPATRTEGSTEHLITFYDDDRFFVDAVVAFLSPALEAGHPAIAIASADHLAAIDAALAARRPAPTGRLIAVDADGALDRLLVRHQPDGVAFRGLIDDVLPAHVPPEEVRIFGEMVAILWERGDMAATVALEDLWGQVVEERRFALLCAYPSGAFDDRRDATAVRTLCAGHSSVIPSVHYRHVRRRDAQRALTDALLHGASGSREPSRARPEDQGALSNVLEQLEGLRESDRIRSTTVAMVAHDLRTPLEAVTERLARLLETSTALPRADITTGLAQALADTRRIEGLLDDLLELSQAGSDGFTYNLQPVTLTDVIERAIADTRLVTGRDIRLHAPSGLPTALVDVDRQMQILTNLLTNAARYSPPGTPIDVAVTTRSRELLVSIHDRGPGIVPEDRERLFRPFSRLDAHTRPTTSGTGLGLYISKTLVEGQGGSIWIEPGYSHGTTFCYTALTTRTSGPARRGR